MLTHLVIFRSAMVRQTYDLPDAFRARPRDFVLISEPGQPRARPERGRRLPSGGRTWRRCGFHLLTIGIGKILPGDGEGDVAARVEQPMEAADAAAPTLVS